MLQARNRDGVIEWLPVSNETVNLTRQKDTCMGLTFYMLGHCEQHRKFTISTDLRLKILCELILFLKIEDASSRKKYVIEQLAIVFDFVCLLLCINFETRWEHLKLPATISQRFINGNRMHII